MLSSKIFYTAEIVSKNILENPYHFSKSTNLHNYFYLLIHGHIL